MSEEIMFLAHLSRSALSPLSFGVPLILGSCNFKILAAKTQNPPSLGKYFHYGLLTYSLQSVGHRLTCAGRCGC